MFKHFGNIETAFKHVKLFTFIIVAAAMAISCFAIFQSVTMVSRSGERIYLLANGKALEAFASDRKESIPIEGKDHIKMFHHFFFTLDPDDKVIDKNIRSALNLADGSARKQYEDLKEANFYSNIISGNISQKIEPDSIVLDLSQYPYHFKYYGKQDIVRPTAIVTRSLITEGTIRNVSRSDNNPHGFLLERWRILQNSDLTIQKR